MDILAMRFKRQGKELVEARAALARAETEVAEAETRPRGLFAGFRARPLAKPVR